MANDTERQGTDIGEAERTLVERFVSVKDQVNANAALVRRGKYFTGDFIVRIGTTSCFISIRQGKIETIEQTPQTMRSSAFTVGADPADWDVFWQPYPPPKWHDIFAMIKFGRARIEGDIHTLMCHLQYVKDVLAMPRSAKEAS